MRVPPHSHEAEVSLLGALTLDPDAFDEVNSLLTPEDFYKESHRHIYRAMEELSQRQQVIDIVTLVQKLSDDAKLEAVGGMDYIVNLSSQVPTAAHITFYAEIIRKKALLRRTIALTHEIADSCYGDVEDVETFLNEAESRLLQISDQKSSSPVKALKDVVRETFYLIEQLAEQDEPITGVSSGFVDLDQKTAGWQRSDLIIIAARPAMGKTAFTLNMAANAATRFEKSVLFCSLEMSAPQLATRLLASGA